MIDILKIIRRPMPLKKRELINFVLSCNLLISIIISIIFYNTIKLFLTPSILLTIILFKLLYENNKIGLQEQKAKKNKTY